MIAYTLEQRREILRHYFENHGNVAECVRKLCTDFGGCTVSSVCSLSCEKLKETVILIENIGAVAEGVCEASLTSIHRRSQQLNDLHKDFGMAPYKVQLV